MDNPQPGAPWDAEAARDAGRKSGEARRRKRDLSPVERAEEAAGRDAPQLVKELLDAAHGRGSFEGLNADLRLKALIRALEYGLGRPSTTPKGPGADQGTPPSPEDLFA